MTMSKKPTIRSMHDYISVNFGQGQVFTVNRNGAKGTNVSGDVFTALDNFVQQEVKKPGGDYGKAIDALVANIDAIWADWSRPMPTFQTGDLVIGPRGKKGKVVGKARTNIKVQFEGDRFVTSISPCLLKRGK
jgi:hypothetical protein